MRSVQYPDSRNFPAYIRLTLPLCALIVLSGCAGHRCGVAGKAHGLQGAHNSPITGTDGSMVVRTQASFDLHAHNLTVSSGQACLIVSACKRIGVKGKNWTILSSDGKAKIETHDHGKTIVATGTGNDDKNIPDDGTDGPGKEFGYGSVVFSPATLKFEDGRTRSLDCKMKKCRIEIYYIVK
jgi:hypothetical protein